GRRRAVEAGLAERLEDRFALERVEVIRQRLTARRRRRCAGCRRRREAQVVDPDFMAAGEGQRPLQDVLELAHVAREVVLPEALERGSREARRQRAGLAREPLEDRVGKEADVLAALAQRRHGELDDVDAVEEILAKAP